MPSGLTFTVTNKAELLKWFGDWAKQVVNGKLMAAVSSFQLQQIFKTFRMDGARDDFDRWPGFHLSTIHSVYRLKDGTWKISPKWRKRPGTDGSKTRRYSPASKLLRASGGFRNSFHVAQLFNDRAIVGTLMDEAEHIIGDPDGNHYRPVIRISASDMTEFRRLLLQHMTPISMVSNG